MLSIVRMIALIATGLCAGIIFGDRLGKTYSRTALDSSGSVRLQQIPAAAAAIVFPVAIARIVNVPINDALMTWSASAPPPDMRARWAPWESAHAVRAAASVPAFALQLIALSVAAR